MRISGVGVVTFGDAFERLNGFGQATGFGVELGQYDRSDHVSGLLFQSGFVELAGAGCVALSAGTA